MPHRHSLSDEEVAAFHAAIKGTVPIRKAARVLHEQPKPSPRPRRQVLDEKTVITEFLHGPFEIDGLAADDVASFLRSGLPRSVLRDLRRGRWTIQDHTDLHGLDRYEAHEAVSRFLTESLQTGKRCIRIVHGRGGVLRQLVKSWLSRNKNVLAFCHAPSSDGGEGALWILLRYSGIT